jgi:hypothetical protein
MGFLEQLHCLCISDNSTVVAAKSSIVAKTKNVPANVSVVCKAATSVSALATFNRASSQSTVASTKVTSHLTVKHSPKQELKAKTNLKDGVSLIASQKQVSTIRGNLTVGAEKFAGDFGNFDCVQKLYPVADLLVSGFISSSSSVPLYPFVDEGVFTGTLSDFNIVANDADYIFPSSYTTSGTFTYSSELSAPVIRPENSAFRFRASAPLYNRETDIPPRFTLKNILFKDPSGNLIVKYKDLSFFGDNYFTTYSTLPEDNRTLLNDWDVSYPLLGLSSGYNLTFDVYSENLADPFDYGFDYGFEEYWRTPNFSGGLIDNLKISAFEICNSGGYGPRPANYMRMYMEVQPTGRRLEKIVRPIGMPIYPEISEIWPVASSIWTAQNGLNNTNKCGVQAILNSLRNDSEQDYITMSSTSPIVNSGRLLLKFGHGGGPINEVTKGAFGCAFDESICGMWIEPSGAYNTLNKEFSHFDDNFFTVDSVSLKVLAKKAPGSRDYVLDIIGYSNDFLLNVTSASGGFLQNIEGSGTLPPVLTVYAPNDLAVGGAPLSDRGSISIDFLDPSGGDHYLLSTRPVINSTTFKWYEIPLKIYPDNVLLGASRDYSMSSLFEQLFLDIYPIPSGAEIASMQLLVRYAPQNAFNIVTQGGEDIGRVNLTLTPNARRINDSIINAGSGYSARSLITNIPQGYYDNNAKSNYARRWRGMEGLVNGPFDPNQFDFGFNNPLLDYPFLYSYYNFDNIVGNTVYPQQGSGTATIISSLPTYKYNNIGWRLTNDSIFNLDLPGYSGLYRTTDWTSLASGLSTFASHSLHGKIADAFSSAVKVSGLASYIRSDNINISGGFAAYVRFIPGPRMSGVSYNLWNSGTLLAKYNASNIQFGIRYSGGRLVGFCRDASNNYVSVQDPLSFSDYQYPLSVVLTYNDNGSQRLKLYTNNELTPITSRLRATSSTFTMMAGSGDLYVGYAPTSGVGIDGFITEFGISNSGNLVETNPDLLYKETTVDTFLNNQHMHWWASGESYLNDSYKLWDYINEDTQRDWNLGDFKYCQFGPAFSQLSKRTGRDLISFSIRNSGLPYSNFVNQFPSTVNSGVSYHTQIENDFLRFNLSDTENNFYAAYPRITKNLPHGYKFSEKAIVVETILEHESSGAFYWGPCEEIGPKLIVSLYTKTKEPYWTQNNWGLVNRSIHHVEPSSCFIKLNSTFNYKDYVDKSEKWALFPREPYLTEFTEKYYSTDVDDMILQYDLIYPSGSPYYSRINIHSANVKLENAFASINDINASMNIMASSAYIDVNQLNVLLDARLTSSEELNLYTFGPLQVQSSGFPLLISGTLLAPATMNLHSISLGSGFNVVNLVTSGSPAIPIYSDSGAFNLHMYAKGIIDSRSGEYLGISLTTLNTDSSFIPEPNVLNLFAFGSSGVDAIRSNLPIYILNDIDSQLGPNSGVLNISMLAKRALFSRYVDASLNLFTFSNRSQEKINLVLVSDPEQFTENESLNLHTINFYSNLSSYLNWYNYNYGKDIELDDNDYASLPANDDIRGVDLIGYGACDSDSPRKAIDPAIVTHDTVWREETCNDGGIFRAINTYTGGAYSGNYYGIRKYDGLVPNTAYNITLNVKTGSTEPIPVPNEWEEWEYGTNSETNYNNVKLIADYPSGVIRNANDIYGQAVSVSKDLLAVGISQRSIPDESGALMPYAGSVSLYRRGVDIPGKQAPWYFLGELTLPSGYKRDYISATYENMLCFPDNTNPEFCVSGQRWNIGQEGREFGYSVDVTSSGDREVVVVGAPKAKWTRQFENIVVSGVPIAMMVFTDKFDYNKTHIAQIGAAANKWNILYKYFAAPWSGGFQPQIDLKLIICQLTYTNQDKPPVFIDEPWVYHTYLDRLDDVNAPNAYASMLSGIWSTFIKAFPRDINLVDKNIPAILGIFEDNSPSTINGAAFKAGVDAFKGQYLPYSYASGVISAVNGIPLSGYIYNIKDRAENWWSASTDLINESLNYENLIATDNLKYITSGVGQQFARSNSYEFQIPPPSGGRVYIFEKENDKFNLIQAIVSPDEKLEGIALSNGGPALYGTSAYDLFGHDVAISNNGNTLAIGSPYSSEPCQIYERQDSENDRMYSRLREWLSFRNLSSDLSYYDNLLAISGFDIASRYTYYNLSQSNKFFLRSDEPFWNNNNRGGPIDLYKKVYDYTYRDIVYTGTWQFVAQEFAGTSRLGWSVDLNDDGTAAVFGAPTDSFNEYDDINIWYDKINDTWASYVNAGAARVFESRNYYPHNLVVEYYKFGNLDRNSHSDLVASGYYDQMGLYFAPANIPFRRTEFAELNIPQEAGLAFVITPELDAASDEVVNRIKDWLELGDRTLVLVGNDPVWEDNGKYNKSNQIINKILQKLGSRMRLHPARNQYESLPDCADVSEKRYNVTPSFVPDYAHITSVFAGNMYAKGVADIKIDLSKDGLQNLLIRSFCDEEINPFCELPIKHLGDLRAQWNEVCERTVGDKKIEIKYKENWPFHFANPNPAQLCDNYPVGPKPEINRPYEDPRPILTAAEWYGGETIIVPARSGVYLSWSPIYEERVVNTPYWDFAENHIPSSVFSIQEDELSGISGEFNSFVYGGFVDPEPFENRDALAQAIGSTYFLEPVPNLRKVDDYQTIAATNTVGSSEVFMIATQFPENENSLTSTNNNDENYYFYNNLVLQACNTPGKILQLGGWTGRTSFENAYPASQLLRTLVSYGHQVNENYTGDLYDIYNIVWIANPLNKPSNSELSALSSWLQGNDKRLVITYNNNQVVANNVSYICSGLGLSMAPHYSVTEGKFLTSMFAGLGTNAGYPQQLDQNHPSIQGCGDGYSWLFNGISTKVNEVVIITENTFDINTEFIPISGGNKVIYYNKELNETYWTNPTAWKIDAKSTIEFPTLPGSGYRLFVNWVAENTTEKYGIGAYADKVAGPDPSDTRPRENYIGLLDGSLINQARSTQLNVKAPLNYLEVKFDTSQHFRIPDQGFVPKTPRILSVSGCLLPIVEFISTSTENVLVGYSLVEIPWYEPERTIVIPPQFRPIMTDSAKYCIDGCPGKLIQDGPVIVAEEYENFTSFTNGSQRSKIVVISDSTMIQGQCPDYRNEALRENQAFIRSLYPQSPTGVFGKQFEFTQKLIAPERGSPGKYYTVSGISSLAANFGSGVFGEIFRYTDDENNYNPATLSRPANPITYEEKEKEIKYFRNTIIPLYKTFPRLSGAYIDPGMGGGVPNRVRAGLKDLIEGDNNYVGDLFGYSVSIHNDQIAIGSVYNGFKTENIIPWDSNVASGTQLGPQGGAGAVFNFQRTLQKQDGYGQIVPWEFKQKIKPSSLMPGDIFGRSISMDGDFVAIGAPKHDYITSHQHIYAGSAAFIRKEFTKSFNIPQHIFDNFSPSSIPNVGAIFTYQNKLVDWQNRTKSWELAERINASGYASPQSNDNFGHSVYIDRARRGDADYTLVVGAPLHDYPTSGNHYTGVLSDAGAVYIYDAMLREQVESIPNSGSWIKARVFGDSNNQDLNIKVYQNVFGPQEQYETQGLVFTNNDGEIYLEASGFDPASRGFIAHRPYITSVNGQLAFGTENNNNVNLFISGAPIPNVNSVNLSLIGPDMDQVYNTLNLSTTSWNSIEVGSGTPPLNIVTSGAIPGVTSGVVNILMSGVGVNYSPLNLRIRGK